MKEKFKVVVSAIAVIMLILFFVITGVTELVDSSKREDIKIDYASECVSIKHSLNGLIPIGTNHYYYAYSEEADDLFIIRADKNWLSENFTIEGEPKEEGYTVTTYQKLLDSDLSKDVKNTLLEDNIQVDVTYYRDTLYQSIAIKKIIAGVCTCVCALAYLLCMMVPDYDTKKHIYARVALVGLVLACFFGISVLAFL